MSSFHSHSHSHSLSLLSVCLLLFAFVTLVPSSVSATTSCDHILDGSFCNEGRGCGAAPWSRCCAAGKNITTITRGLNSTTFDEYYGIYCWTDVSRQMIYIGIPCIVGGFFLLALCFTCFCPSCWCSFAARKERRIMRQKRLEYVASLKTASPSGAIATPITHDPAVTSTTSDHDTHTHTNNNINNTMTKPKTLSNNNNNNEMKEHEQQQHLELARLNNNHHNGQVTSSAVASAEPTPRREYQAQQHDINHDETNTTTTGGTTNDDQIREGRARSTDDDDSDTDVNVAFHSV